MHAEQRQQVIGWLCFPALVGGIGLPCVFILAARYGIDDFAPTVLASVYTALTPGETILEFLGPHFDLPYSYTALLMGNAAAYTALGYGLLYARRWDGRAYYLIAALIAVHAGFAVAFTLSWVDPARFALLPWALLLLLGVLCGGVAYVRIATSRLFASLGYGGLPEGQNAVDAMRAWRLPAPVHRHRMQWLVERHTLLPPGRRRQQARRIVLTRYFNWFTAVLLLAAVWLDAYTYPYKIIVN